MVVVGDTIHDPSRSAQNGPHSYNAEAQSASKVLGRCLPDPLWVSVGMSRSTTSAHLVMNRPEVLLRTTPFGKAFICACGTDLTIDQPSFRLICREQNRTYPTGYPQVR